MTKLYKVRNANGRKVARRTDVIDAARTILDHDGASHEIRAGEGMWELWTARPHSRVYERDYRYGSDASTADEAEQDIYKQVTERARDYGFDVRVVERRARDYGFDVRVVKRG